MTRTRFAIVLLAAAGIVLPMVPAAAAVRIKDIADVEGVRDNQLVGYGLVVGLNGTGDDITRSIFTRESLIGMLERLGVNARSTQLKTKDVAAVAVTATLPPFSRQGGKIDVVVSAIGDANNLMGGTLLVTPLLGADGEVYAVAQGQIATGSFKAQGAGASVTKGVPSAGKISNGGIVEREVAFALASSSTLRLALRNPDFTTARRMATAINAVVRGSAARALDSGTVELQVPSGQQDDIVGLVTQVEQIRIEPDEVAKVIIDEANGVIVMGENVRISTVAVAQGNLTVRITETPQVSQPGPFAPQGATTTTVPRTTISVDEQANRKLAVMQSGASLADLVAGLNSLGIGPRDMISILQNIKAAGALQATIEVR